MLAHSKNLTLKRCYMKKGRGANVLYNLTQAMLTTASWGALIGVNSNTGCDNISAFFRKGKWKAVQLLQPMEGTSELWRVSNENFKFKIPKHTYVSCTERSGMVRCYEIHPQLKAGRSSWRICRPASYLFNLQEQLSSLNVRKNHRSAPHLGTLR